MIGRYLLAPAGIFLAAIAAWLAFWGSPIAADPARMHYSPFDLDIPVRMLPPLLLLLTAAATSCIIGGLLMLRSQSSSQHDMDAEEGRPWQGAMLISSLAPVAAVAIVAAAAILDDAVVPNGGDERASGLILLLGAGGLIALVALVAALASGKNVGMESQWGGLGGSIGGWSISPSAVALLVFLACFGGMVAVIAPAGEAEDAGSTVNNLADQNPKVANPKDENAGDGNIQGDNAAGGVKEDANRGKKTSAGNLDE